MSRSPDNLRLATESVAGQRPYQEDAVLTETLSDGRTLVAVADGMGGHAAGEVASALALESLVEGLEEGRSLPEAFGLANERVHARAKDPGKKGMGTTLVAMVLDGDSYEIANVGDSRGYVIRDEGIRQITKDHSFVAEAMDRGTSEEEAKASKWKDALTRSIGTDAEVEADLYGPFPVEPDTAVLLCSDGLYKVMDGEALKGIFAGSGGPGGAAQALVAAALERGSDDNISVAIAEFGEVPRERAAGTLEFEWEPPEGAEEEAAAEAPTAGGSEPPRETTAEGSGSGISRGAIVAVVVILLAAVAGLVLALGS